MFLKNLENDHLVEILNISDLFNPFKADVEGRYHWGEEVQEPDKFRKIDLIFPSGEKLPQCWLNSHYRDEELIR